MNYSHLAHSSIPTILTRSQSHRSGVVTSEPRLDFFLLTPSTLSMLLLLSLLQTSASPSTQLLVR